MLAVVTILLVCLNLGVSIYALLVIMDVKAKQKRSVIDNENHLSKIAKDMERLAQSINQNVSSVDKKVDRLSLDAPIE